MITDETELGVLRDKDQVKKTISRLAHEVVEKMVGRQSVCLVATSPHSLVLAERVAQAIQRFSEGEAGPPDVTVRFFSKDVGDVCSARYDEGAGVVQLNIKPFEEKFYDWAIIVVEAISSGRNVLSAMTSPIGSPARFDRIGVFALIDAGGREVPITLTFVGVNVPPIPGTTVRVSLSEIDGADEISRIPIEA